jgi:hypothetical protein
VIDIISREVTVKHEETRSLMKSFSGGPDASRAVFSKRGSATPTYSRSVRCRSFGASSQKFAEETKFHKKKAPGKEFINKGK